MKLISAHIKNFGAISNQTIDFDDKMTCLCKENGYGKTTIAAFIKAMLFGIDKVSSKTFSDRQHYYPFNGKIFGGSLTVKYNDQIITIIREFDKKSNSKDVVKVIDERGNDLKWNVDEIGKKILDIDAKSFESTLFLKSTDLSFENTESISLKLNGLINDGSESYESIIDSIDKSCKSIKRDDNRGNSKIKDLKTNIANLENKIREYRCLEDSLQEQYIDSSNYEKQLKELNEKKNLIAIHTIKKEKYNQYQNKLNELNKLVEDKESLLSKYPGGLLNNEDLSNLDNHIKEKDKIDNILSLYFLNENEKSLLDSLNKKYNNSIISSEDINLLNEYKVIINSTSKLISKDYEISYPSKEEINKYEKLINDYKNNNDGIEKKFVKSSNIEEIEKEFIDGIIKIEQLKDIEDKIIELNDLESKKQGYHNLLLGDLNNSSKKNFVSKILFALSAILLILSAVLFSIDKISFIISLITGLISLSVAIIFTFIKKGNNTQNIKNEAVELEAKINLKKQELRTIFAKYRISGDDFKSNLNILTNNANDYNNYLTELESFNENVEKLKEINAKLYIQIKEFFDKYDSFDNDFNQCILTLNKKIQEYDNYINNKKTIKEYKEKVVDILNKYNITYSEDLNVIINENEKLASLNNTYENYLKNYQLKVNNDEIINNILNKYSLTLSEDYLTQIETLKSDFIKLNNFDEEIIKKDREAKKYKIDNDVIDYDKDLINANIDFESVDEEINKISTSLYELNTTIKSNEEKVGKIDDCLKEIESLKQEVSFYEDKYDKLIITKILFMQAQNNLHNRYIKPMEQSFIKYSKAINKFISEDATINFDFDVNYKNGSKNHLSEGQKTCLALCMRLAVIENMYKGEKPFIILDDPFINLDKDNIKKSIDVINELSKQYQIIYFTCHSSRNIVNSK